MKHQFIKIALGSLCIPFLPLPSASGQHSPERARAAAREVANPQGAGEFGGPAAEAEFDGPPGRPGGPESPGVPGGPGGPVPEHRHVDWQEKVSQLDLTKLPAASDTKDAMFEKDIRPMLSASCTQCHGSDRTRGGLRLDTLDNIRQGGDSGPAIIAGNSKESPLVISAARIDPDTAMPPQRGRRFDPVGMVAGQMISQAHADGQAKVSKEEFVALAKTWFDAADREKTGTVSEEQFASAVSEMLRPQGLANDDRGRGRPRGFGPGGPGGFDPLNPVARALFEAASGQKTGSLTSSQLQNAFAGWFNRWDTDKSGSLTEEKLRVGLGTVLPAMPSGQDRRPLPPGGRAGFGGPGGPGGGPPAKPLTSEQVSLLRAWIDQGAK